MSIFRPSGRRSLHACRARRQQQGAIAVLAAILFGLAIAALGAIDIGHFYLARRDLQRTADLAATAAATTIGSAGGCGAATTSAQLNATANGLPADGTVAVLCGRWDPVITPTSPYFSQTATPINAARVTVSRSVGYLFLVGQPRPMSAVATAQATNVGAYSIGTSLLAVGSTICGADGTGASAPTGSTSQLNGLLNALLGANLQLQAVSYCGLANTRLKVSDLMVAAGVGTVDGLLKLPVSVGSLAKLMLSALQTTSVVNAQLQAGVGALTTIVNANIPGGQFLIGDKSGAPGLISLGLATTQAALDATISPFDALMVAAEIAAKGQAPVSLAAGINLPGLTTSLSVQVIQPPVLAVGEAGINPATGTWRTMARSAQIRAYLNINLGTASLPLGILGALIPINVSLPLYLEASPGQAWLVSTQCAATKGACRSTIGVQTGLANLCVGDPPANMAASQPFSCNTPATLINVLNLIKVQANVALPAVVPMSNAPNMSFDGIVGNADDYQSTNANAAGSVISNALSGLGASLSTLNIQLLGINLPLGGILSPIVALLGNVLSPILGQLDAILVPLLQVLGAQIGVSTIHDMSLTCGVAKLVN